MEKYEILVIFWQNNWSEDERMVMSFADLQEAKQYCEEQSTVYEERSEDSNSWYRNGTDYIVLGRV
jgi:hypothetical protein